MFRQGLTMANSLDITEDLASGSMGELEAKRGFFKEELASMKTLAGRAAEPIEIINAFLYLASDEGAFINGETLLMDGGRNVMFNKY